MPPERRSLDPGIALALSGGAARCIAQIGVLEVLHEAGIPIHAVAATSAGAIVGALYASGRYATPEIVHLARALRWRDIVKPRIPRMGLIDSDKIHRYMKGLLGNSTFEDLTIPLAVTACDLKTGEKIILKEGSVARAVQASCSLPVIFTPTRLENRLLVDGGIVSQLPILAAKEASNGGFTVSVDVNHNALDANGLNNMFQIAVHVVGLFARRNANIERPYADIQINVDAADVPLYALEKRELLLKRGRLAAKEKIAAIREGLRGRATEPV